MFIDHQSPLQLINVLSELSPYPCTEAQRAGAIRKEINILGKLIGAYGTQILAANADDIITFIEYPTGSSSE
jgi:hypothetical protein